MKRYASCYCRYSSDKQQQQSIDHQLERIEAFCKKHDITLIEQYIDEAQTGTSDQRKAFQRMIEDSEHSKWGYLLVYDLSRLARNVEDQMFYQKILKQHGIMIISVEEKFDSSPEGHLFSLITAGINEYYSKHLAKRSFAGVMQNAKKGIAIGGIPPLGFDVDENKHYIINKKEAESVKIIFNKTAAGWSRQEIKDYLNEEGYLSKRGRPFSNSFYEILRNRKYIGEYVFNLSTKKKSRGKRSDRVNNEDDIVRIPGGLPQIIDKQTFDKVQHMLNKRRNSSVIEFKPTKYLMSGRLECGYCGMAYSGGASFSKRRNIPYAYYGHLNYKQGRCKSKDIPVLYIDNWVKEFVIKDFLSMNNLSERTKDINDQIKIERDKIKQEIKALKSRMSSIETILQEKAKQLVSSNFSIFALEDAEETKNEMAKIERELRQKQRRMELLKRITNEKLAKTIKKFKNLWKSKENYDDLGKFIYEMLSRLVITNEIIKAYINYDMITRKLCDFDIEIASIDRSLLMRIWRN
ncbi:recombinase family protein [Mariniplasma anaerobium]|uniref:Integrase n=1 Tax=Mariniplasma anaerobium TaxID=2735436 RepID=A0A7U9THL6_9MOLU|nr:recombinase family protein [Mariniplasma anaerobium]BCR35199.1 integrase [Mariniplasma anaerobium]